VWKYGQDIGLAKADIRKGEHVHVHNLKTKRW
jgi:(2R)-sulfolactate sulfo-lyase subunit alpha